jgi:cytochrome P450
LWTHGYQDEAVKEEHLPDLPAYLPSGTRTVAHYRQTLEVLRSSCMGPEPPGENEAVLAGSLTKHGDKHTHRRRLMNQLVRTEALAQHHANTLEPAIRRELVWVGRSPSGTAARADLLDLSKRIFLQVAAAIVGLDISAPRRTDRLMQCNC